jgi:hypothetical protein
LFQKLATDSEVIKDIILKAETSQITTQINLNNIETQLLQIKNMSSEKKEKVPLNVTQNSTCLITIHNDRRIEPGNSQHFSCTMRFDDDKDDRRIEPGNLLHSSCTMRFDDHKDDRRIEPGNSQHSSCTMRFDDHKDDNSQHMMDKDVKRRRLNDE